MKNKKNILDLINLKLQNNDFTSTQKDIANFIKFHPDKLAFLDLKQLSEETNTSPSSIIRFAKELDLDGFNDLQSSVLSEIYSNEANESNEEFNGLNILSLVDHVQKTTKLTKTQNKIASYILDSPDKVVDSSTRELSNELDTSPGTIIKFIQDKLKMEGFVELQKQIKLQLEDDNPISKLFTGEMSPEEEKEFLEVQNQKSLRNDEDRRIIGYANLLLENLHDSVSNILKSYKGKRVFSEFYLLVSSAANIIILDEKNKSRFSFHENLNSYGFKNYYFDSSDRCLKSLDEFDKNLKQKYKKSSRAINKHISIDENLEKFLSKKTVGEKNLLILVATTTFNPTTNKVLKAAIDKDFDVILIESDQTKNKIGEIDNINLRVNLGDLQLIENYNDNREPLTEMFFYTLLNIEFRRKLKNEEKYGDELY
jgi:DNA-binding MurR/RpiR family transcriptional regulator